MILAEQVSILLEAAENELLQPEDMVRWADHVIEAMDDPPAFVLELSMLKSPYLADYVHHLREQQHNPVSRRRRIQIAILGHAANRLALPETLSKLFPIVYDEQAGRESQLNHESLAQLLGEWDCQDSLEIIALPLKLKLSRLFREYLLDADEVAAVLSWGTENLR